MDPITQGTLGAAASQVTGRSIPKERWTAYAWLGCLAGMAPDLDVFIQSASDPILFLEYHRHFTHSLIFIPIGALIVAAVLHQFAKKRLTFKQSYLACLAGYATHGLLDACTSYGTLLFWPFSDVRIAWNNISVVDPLFTLPLLALVLTTAWTKRTAFVIAGLIWAGVYLLFGVFQHNRAIDIANASALERGHAPSRLTAKAGIGNLLVWKTIYEHDGAYYVDAARVGLQSMICRGEHIEKLDLAKHFPNLKQNSQQAQDIERFRWFSDDYLAPYNDGALIVDVRYANVPNQIHPLWGIFIDSDKTDDKHVEFWSNRRVEDAEREALLALIRGEDCRIPVAS